MNSTLRSILPDLYAPLLPAFFDHATPREEKATCASCAMCSPAAGPTALATNAVAPAPPAYTTNALPETVSYFRPETKCCTYQPMLPNYLVGAILADHRPEMQEGKRRIRERIALRIGVSPRWIAAPRKRTVLWSAAWRNTFGRSLMLACPYLDREQGRCTIWTRHESMCTTFFCKYNAGQEGEAFWRALRRYLVWFENTLSERAARAVIPGYEEPRRPAGEMTVEEIEDRPPTETLYASMWQDWLGSEEALYVRCYEHVRTLTPEDVAELTARADHEERLRGLDAARENMLRPKLPLRLVPNPDLASVETEGGALVRAYSRYEPLMLSADHLAVVRAFAAGGTVAEVRARVRHETGEDIPDDLLLRLHQFRVLVDPDANDAPAAARGEPAPPAARPPA